MAAVLLVCQNNEYNARLESQLVERVSQSRDKVNNKHINRLQQTPTTVVSRRPQLTWVQKHLCASGRQRHLRWSLVSSLHDDVPWTLSVALSPERSLQWICNISNEYLSHESPDLICHILCNCHITGRFVQVSKDTQTCKQTINNTDDCGCQAKSGCPVNGCETVVCLCYRISRFTGTCLVRPRSIVISNVCLSICPWGYLQKHMCDLYKSFLCMLPTAVARSSSGMVTKSQGKGAARSENMLDIDSMWYITATVSCLASRSQCVTFSKFLASLNLLQEHFRRWNHFRFRILQLLHKLDVVIIYICHHITHRPTTYIYLSILVRISQRLTFKVSTPGNKRFFSQAGSLSTCTKLYWINLLYAEILTIILPCSPKSLHSSMKCVETSRGVSE